MELVLEIVTKNIFLSFIIICIVLALGILVFNMFRREKVSLNNLRIQPKVSLVLLVKNNEHLLSNLLSFLSQNKSNFHEFIVFDLGSIDRSLEMARSKLKDYSNVQIITFFQRVHIDVSSVLPQFVTGDTVLLLDLDKMGKENPNIYIPDLFRGLESLPQKLPAGDHRIDGTKLLRFDQLEREKNSYILNQLMIEALNNVNSRMKSLLEIKSNRSVSKEQMEVLYEYFNQSLKDISLILRLMGPADIISGNLKDNMVKLLEDYAQSHHVAIHYKAIGQEKALKEGTLELLLEVTQDLLHVIVQHNLSSSIQVAVRYGTKGMRLVLKYSSGDPLGPFEEQNTLSQYVLTSIRNRLSLVDGGMSMKIKPGGRILIHVKLPYDQILVQDGESLST